MVLLDLDARYDFLLDHLDHIEQHADLDEQPSGLIAVRERCDHEHEEEIPFEELLTGQYL